MSGIYQNFKSMKKLKDKVIIITGSSSGIGYGLAKTCLKLDMKVVMAARNIESMQFLVKKGGYEESSYLIVSTDVTQPEDCKNLVEQTVNKFGRIDVLVNNAGISMRALFSELEINTIKKIMDVNFWGAVYCTKYALPYLLESKGSIVGVSSIAGYKGLPARTGYSASKFALNGFLETIRIENMKTGLHVLIACPGFTTSSIRERALDGKGKIQGESPRNEDKMMETPVVAKHIMKAVNKRKKTLVLTKQGKLLVWLNKFFPEWVDKMVYDHMAKEPGSPFK